MIEDLPSEGYYAVSVGRRGEQVCTAEDLEEQEWEVNLTSGGA